MAVIGKIRQNAALAIGIVGFSLIAFIMGDFLTSNRSFLGGSETNVAVIAGKKIKIQDFEEKIQQLEFNYKLNNNKETIDQATMDQLRDQAWGQLLNDQTLGVQQEKAGISVSQEELFDMVQGKYIHPQIKDAFKDPNTGQFNAANVIQFLKNMDNDQSGKTRAQWLAFEQAIRKERMGQKYNDLIKMGLYATTAEAKNQSMNTGRQANIRYIQLPYSSVADSLVTPDESRLKSYYAKHQGEYKQEASRHIEYVIFEVLPSAEDRKSAEDYITNLVDPFIASTDDSSFAAINSEIKPDISYHKKGTLSPRLDSVFFSAPVGTMIGPYEENGFIKISKLTSIKDIPDSVKISHALVAFKGAERAPESVTRSHEEAKAMADSLLKLCEKDAAKFIDVATNHSDDAVSALKAGDLDWITMESPMDERFKAGAFDIPKGGVNAVESNFGFHIIKVFDMTRPQKQVQVITIDRKIEPGSKTYQTIFSRANEFAGKNVTAELFDKACVDQGLNKRVLEALSETERNIPGLESARELVRWAYSANKGEVSKAFAFGDKFVVAKLVDIKEKGIAPLEQVRTKVTEEVTKEMKAEMLYEKLNSAASGTTSIDQVAQKAGQQVQSASNINFASPYIANIGMEPAVVGTVFTLKQGQLSKPVKGESGVYVFQVESFTEPPETKDFSSTKKTLITTLGSRSSYEVFNALKEKANITDNRGKFY